MFMAATQPTWYVVNQCSANAVACSNKKLPAGHAPAAAAAVPAAPLPWQQPLLLVPHPAAAEAVVENAQQPQACLHKHIVIKFPLHAETTAIDILLQSTLGKGPLLGT